MINRIQNYRKNSGFDVTDRIDIQFSKPTVASQKTNRISIENAVNKNENYIKTETLANNIIFVEKLENGTEIEFDEIQTKMKITKA